MEWVVAPMVRCDLVGYSGQNCTGARYIVRVFPTGSRKGTFRTEELKSLVIIAPIGTRVVLCTSADPNRWEDQPWRCVRQVAGHRFKNEEGNEGVRIPKLDWQDPPTARRASEDTQIGFPLVQRLADGRDWTFGRAGSVPLEGNIRQIRIDRE